MWVANFSWLVFSQFGVNQLIFKLVMTTRLGQSAWIANFSWLVFSQSAINQFSHDYQTWSVSLKSLDVQIIFCHGSHFIPRGHLWSTTWSQLKVTIFPYIYFQFWSLVHQKRSRIEQDMTNYIFIQPSLLFWTTCYGLIYFLAKCYPFWVILSSFWMYKSGV